MAEQQQSATDAVSTRIGQAVMLLHGGDREEARNRFADLWSELGEDAGPVHRCTLAHYMADTQDDPGDELTWDLRAWNAAAEGLTGERPAARQDLLALHAFSPALHLGLAADYLKLHRPEAARHHLDRARKAADALPDGGRGNGVRTAIDRLAARLREER